MVALGYGKMNLDDFLDLMEGQIRANASERTAENLPAATIALLLEAFRMFDNDKDGYLNMEELKVSNLLSWFGIHLYSILFRKHAV